MGYIKFLKSGKSQANYAGLSKDNIMNPAAAIIASTIRAGISHVKIARSVEYL